MDPLHSLVTYNNNWLTSATHLSIFTANCLNYAKATIYSVITESSLSITEVAHQLGYKHQANFSRANKDKLGVSPKALWVLAKKPNP
ncbi:hypothetical protein OAG1_33330 [Agarivorans sp. OAG1]|nr:hypothetical protein OAG1_33330 [Agarivorans sp. OAG1]